MTPKKPLTYDPERFSAWKMSRNGEIDNNSVPFGTPRKKIDIPTNALLKGKTSPKKLRWKPIKT